MATALEEIFRRLLAHYGPQPRSAAGTPLEELVAAIVRQNSSETNVKRALDNLREAGLLDAHRLSALPPEELEELIQPAGHARLKAQRLRRVLKLLVECYGGSPEAMFAADRDRLRAELLALNGISPETADSILLLAGDVPSFVVDTHTQRVLKRHGWIEFEADYEAVREYVESSLERDPALYREFHALLARVGHEHCGKTPRCEACPLAELLPDGGPREPEF